MAGRGAGPAPVGLLLLVLSAFALLATSATGGMLEAQAIGEVLLDGGGSADRELRVHLDPAAGGATSGTVSVELQSASGLQPGYPTTVAVAIAEDADPAGPVGSSVAFPIDRCQEGCDLDYRVRIDAAPGVLPGSIIRYRTIVHLDYQGSYGPLPSGLLRLDLEGAATGPVAPTWSVVAGLLALLLGVLGGPRVDGALRARRRWPARLLVVVPIGLIGWMIVSSAVGLAEAGVLGQLGAPPGLILAFADPWSLALLATLAWGTWQGLRRWPGDGGWLLGLAAVATTGLGGLWLTWVLTLDAVVQPIGLGLVLAAFGLLGGVVIGQGWRVDPAAGHDRWWAAIAVLSHGIIIAGFGYLADQSLFDPFSTSPASFLTLLPAALVAFGFSRWLGGRRVLLIVVDGLVALAGVLGLLLWTSVSYGFPSSGSGVGTDDVGVGIAIVAAIAALATAFHVMPGRATGIPAGVNPSEPSGDVQPAT